MLPMRGVARHFDQPPGRATLLVVLSSPLLAAGLFDFHPSTLAVPFLARTSAVRAAGSPRARPPRGDRGGPVPGRPGTRPAGDRDRRAHRVLAGGSWQWRSPPPRPARWSPGASATRTAGPRTSATSARRPPRRSSTHGTSWPSSCPSKSLSILAAVGGRRRRGDRAPARGGCSRSPWPGFPCCSPGGRAPGSPGTTTAHRWRPSRSAARSPVWPWPPSRDDRWAQRAQGCLVGRPCPRAPPRQPRCRSLAPDSQPGVARRVRRRRTGRGRRGRLGGRGRVRERRPARPRAAEPARARLPVPDPVRHGRRLLRRGVRIRTSRSTPTTPSTWSWPPKATRTLCPPTASRSSPGSTG